MNARTQIERQMMRCGREPPVADDLLVVDEDGIARAFMHNGQRRRFMTIPKLDAATCPGYASELPEVLDAVGAYPHWKERTLSAWIEGEPTRPLLTCLAAIEAGKNQCESDRVERQRAEREAAHGR